jgi:hypothetical protein
MKFLIAIFFLLASFSCSLKSCDKVNSQTAIRNNRNNNVFHQNGTKVKIIVGSAVLTATLYDNPTTIAFKALLPLTINMSELNGNEKYYYFPGNLPTNAAPGGSIQAGDLMLYGNNCLVLFYKDFNTSYNYTKLGRIDNTSGLLSALGSGNVTVKFELE